MYVGPPTARYQQDFNQLFIVVFPRHQIVVIELYLFLLRQLIKLLKKIVLTL